MLSQALASYSLRRFNRNIQLFLLHGIPFFASLGVFQLLYNLYLLRLGFQEDLIGRLAGMLPLASGLLAVPVGLLSDRIGRKPFLVAGALLQAGAQFGMCTIRDPETLMVLSFIAGFSPAFMFVNHVPFLAENCRPENRGHAISMAFGMQLLTRMVVSLVGGSLPALFVWITGLGEEHPEPFRYTLLLGAGLSLLSVVPILRIREREQADPAGDPDEDVVPAEAGSARRLLLRFMTVSACRGLAFGLSMPFYNVFFDEVLSASAAMIGFVFFAGQLVGFPSSMAAPSLSRRHGPIRCIVPFRVLAALALLVFGGLSELLWGCLVFLLIMAVDSLTTPMEMTFATNVVPRAYWGRVQSLRVAGFQVLAGAGSMWAGEMILNQGYAPTFAVSAGATLISGLVLLVSFGWRRRPERGT